MVTSRTIAISSAFAALLLSGGAVSDASAQGYYGEAGPRPAYVAGPEFLIPPRAVAYRLMDRGFSEVGRPRFDGRAYIVDATNPAGSRVRLYVDARDGAVIGRERLGDPYFPSVRPGRAPAGYGWTEEDGPRGPRDAGRLVPPADIPDAGPSRSIPRQDRAELSPPIPVRPGAADANPSGLNPDAGGRADPPARRSARPSKPAQARPEQARIAPAAPRPRLAPDEEMAKTEPSSKPPAPATAAVEPPNVVEPKVARPKASGPAGGSAAEAPVTPASVQPPPARAAEGAKPAWQDPPAGEARKSVRVIGGATVVPGAGGTSGTNPN